MIVNSKSNVGTTNNIKRMAEVTIIYNGRALRMRSHITL